MSLSSLYIYLVTSKLILSLTYLLITTLTLSLPHSLCHHHIQLSPSHALYLTQRTSSALTTLPLAPLPHSLALGIFSPSHTVPQCLTVTQYVHYIPFCTSNLSRRYVSTLASSFSLPPSLPFTFFVPPFCRSPAKPGLKPCRVWVGPSYAGIIQCSPE